jgi:hypothetical protein
VLSAFHAATVGYLLGFHVFLISRGRTHVEHVCCKGEGPGCSFDTGSVPLNWRDAFGPMLIDWWLPTPSLGAARRGAARTCPRHPRVAAPAPPHAPAPQEGGREGFTE